MTVDELHEALEDTLAEFEDAHYQAQLALERFSQVDADLDLVKATLLDAIAGEIEGTKPKFSNDEKRKAELARRLNAVHGDLVWQHAEADREKRTTAGNKERAHEALKTYRAAAGLRQAELELEAARLHSAIAATPSALTIPAPAPKTNGNGNGKKGPLGKSTVVTVPGVDTDDLPF
jgi:hypothetical protein